jgi:hypothetical protein
MGPTPPVAAPPITAEYATALQPAAPNSAPVQSAFRFCRGAGGQTRVDSGNTSVISNPAAGQTIMLDHVKKTATVQQTLPPPPGLPAMPKPPALPGALAVPKAPNVQVQDLGKSVIQGQAVEGKRFLIPPPPPLPAPPAMPKPPAAPKPPTIADFWHSPALCLPMLTKMSGPFGQMTQACHSAVPGEPHPAAFQIPPGYKVTLAPPPR